MISGKNIEEFSELKADILEQQHKNRELTRQLQEVDEQCLQERQKSDHLQQQILRMKNEYSAAVLQTHAREASLHTLLEIKQQEINDYLIEILKLEQLKGRLGDDKVTLSEEITMIQSTQNTTQRRCTCTEDNRELIALLKEIDLVGRHWKEIRQDDWDESKETTTSLNLEKVQLEDMIKKRSKVCEEYKCRNQSIGELEKILEEKNKCLYKLEHALQDIICSKGEIISQNQDFIQMNKEITEKLEVCKADKEMLANKLEEVHERLVNERIASEATLEKYYKEKETIQTTEEKIAQENIISERLSEQLQNEKASFAKLTEDLMKNSDMDTILEQTLQSLGMEGAIVKVDSDYMHNDAIINLSLHNETFVVVHTDSRLIPFTDFLNTYPSTKHASDRKSENRSMDMRITDKSKSPIRTLSITGANINKSQKTPLRERNLSHKKPFK